MDCLSSAAEEGLEATWLGLCRTMSELDPACLETGLLTAQDAATLLELADVDTVHVVILSDEGDSSRRLDREEVATLYTDLFALLPMRVVLHAVVPALDAEGDLRCPGTARRWGVTRYVDAVERSLGTTHDLFAADCSPGDLEGSLLSIADRVE
jgi:hypothetical protein